MQHELNQIQQNSMNALWWLALPISNCAPWLNNESVSSWSMTRSYSVHAGQLPLRNPCHMKWSLWSILLIRRTWSNLMLWILDDIYSMAITDKDWFPIVKGTSGLLCSDGKCPDGCSLRFLGRQQIHVTVVDTFAQSYCHQTVKCCLHSWKQTNTNNCLVQTPSSLWSWGLWDQAIIKDSSSCKKSLNNTLWTNFLSPIAYCIPAALQWFNAVATCRTFGNQ